MTPGQLTLVVILLSLLALSLGAIGLMVAVISKNSREGSPVAASGIDDRDRVALAHRRREFMKRYPAWATRDFQNDHTSPWYTDPDFSNPTPR